jgi:hypothetical protein
MGKDENSLKGKSFSEKFEIFIKDEEKRSNRVASEYTEVHQNDDENLFLSLMDEMVNGFEKHEWKSKAIVDDVTYVVDQIEKFNIVGNVLDRLEIAKGTDIFHNEEFKLEEMIYSITWNTYEKIVFDQKKEAVEKEAVKKKDSEIVTQLASILGDKIELNNSHECEKLKLNKEEEKLKIKAFNKKFNANIKINEFIPDPTYMVLQGIEKIVFNEFTELIEVLAEEDNSVRAKRMNLLSRDYKSITVEDFADFRNYLYGKFAELADKQDLYHYHIDDYWKFNFVKEIVPWLQDYKVAKINNEISFLKFIYDISDSHVRTKLLKQYFSILNKKRRRPPAKEKLTYQFRTKVIVVYHVIPELIQEFLEPIVKNYKVDLKSENLVESNQYINEFNKEYGFLESDIEITKCVLDALSSCQNLAERNIYRKFKHDKVVGYTKNHDKTEDSELKNNKAKDGLVAENILGYSTKVTREMVSDNWRKKLGSSNPKIETAEDWLPGVLSIPEILKRAEIKIKEYDDCYKEQCVYFSDVTRFEK